MTTLATRTPRVQDILRWRPFLAWQRVPVAAALCVLEYDDAARTEILDRLAGGASLRDLAPWLVEAADLGALEAAIVEGRTPGWMARYRERGGFVLPPICGGSDDADRAIDWSAVRLVPPELDAIEEALGVDDASIEARYRTAIVEVEIDDDPRGDDTRLCPCGRMTDEEPCKCDPLTGPEIDRRLAELAAEPSLPPIAGGTDDDAVWCDEPADADWAWLEMRARDFPPSGGLD